MLAFFYRVINKICEKNKFKLFDINFPFFETPYFTKKNLLKLLDKRKVSPLFMDQL